MLNTAAECVFPNSEAGRPSALPLPLFLLFTAWLLWVISLSKFPREKIWWNQLVTLQHGTALCAKSYHPAELVHEMLVSPASSQKMASLGSSPNSWASSLWAERSKVPDHNTQHSLASRCPRPLSSQGDSGDCRHLEFHRLVLLAPTCENRSGRLAGCGNSRIRNKTWLWSSRLLGTHSCHGCRKWAWASGKRVDWQRILPRQGHPWRGLARGARGARERTKPQAVMAILAGWMAQPVVLWEEGMQQTQTQHLDRPEFLKGLRDKRDPLLDGVQGHP